MKADDGETLHGFRSGCAITLALTGADLPEIMEHVGWARRHTALYYLQLAKVLKHDGPSGRLATPSAENVVAPWQDVNQLKRFVCFSSCCAEETPSRMKIRCLARVFLE